MIKAYFLILCFQDGDKFWRMPECYIRGSTIKYLRIPDEVIDMVKEEVVAKGRGRGDGKGRGGGQRGGRGGNRGMNSILHSIYIFWRVFCYYHVLLYAMKDHTLVFRVSSTCVRHKMVCVTCRCKYVALG